VHQVVSSDKNLKVKEWKMVSESMYPAWWRRSGRHNEGRREDICCFGLAWKQSVDCTKLTDHSTTNDGACLPFIQLFWPNYHDEAMAGDDREGYPEDWV
jgi:hypothetical protein